MNTILSRSKTFTSFSSDSTPNPPILGSPFSPTPKSAPSKISFLDKSTQASLSRDKTQEKYLRLKEKTNALVSAHASQIASYQEQIKRLQERVASKDRQLEDLRTMLQYSPLSSQTPVKKESKDTIDWPKVIALSLSPLAKHVS